MDWLQVNIYSMKRYLTIYLWMITDGSHEVRMNLCFFLFILFSTLKGAQQKINLFDSAVYRIAQKKEDGIVHEFSIYYHESPA